MTMKSMRAIVIYTLVAVVILGIMGGSFASIDDGEREIMLPNYPFGRGVDNDMQLAKLLLLPQRSCHIKRNSELINSLLGLPKNMNNAGRK